MFKNKKKKVSDSDIQLKTRSMGSDLEDELKEDSPNDQNKLKPSSPEIKQKPEIEKIIKPEAPIETKRSTYPKKELKQETTEKKHSFLETWKEKREEKRKEEEVEERKEELERLKAVTEKEARKEYDEKLKQKEEELKQRAAEEEVTKKREKEEAEKRKIEELERLKIETKRNIKRRYDEKLKQKEEELKQRAAEEEVTKKREKEEAEKRKIEELERLKAVTEKEAKKEYEEKLRQKEKELKQGEDSYTKNFFPKNSLEKESPINLNNKTMPISREEPATNPKNYDNFLKDKINPQQKGGEIPKNKKKPLMIPDDAQKPLISKEEVTSNSKKYDEFFKDKINSQQGNKESEAETSSNSVLIIILLVILVIAIASGAYYYFFVLSKPAPPVSQPVVVEPDPSFPVEPIPVEKEALDILKESATEITIMEDAELKTVLLDSQNPNNLTPGFYTVKKGEKTLSAEEISLSLGIDLQEIITVTSQNAWIYYNSPTKPEIGIAIEINQENQIGAKQLIMSMENDLPNMVSSLYSTPISQSSVKDVAFEESTSNSGFRYYNSEETSSLEARSLDWGIIDDSVLVIATSKGMAPSISKQLLDTNPDDVTTGDTL